MSPNTRHGPGAFRGAREAPAQNCRTEIFADGHPSRLDPFIAVERTIARNALGPTFDPLAMRLDQQHTPALAAPEAGLKEMLQGHAQLVQRNGFNLHSSDG